MGIFNKLFAKEPKNIEKEHIEEWTSYFTNVDNKYSSIALDLGFYKMAPVNSKDHILWISIEMENPRSDGLSSNEESEVLWKIEDEIVESLQNKYQSLFVGRLTSDGMRTLYFYLGKENKHDKDINNVMKKYSSYKYQFGIKKDNKWEGYLGFLYPTPKNFQQITNEQVIRSLEDNGDNLTKPRPVHHWIYFTNENDQNGFLKSIKDMSFKIENRILDKDDESRPYGIEISRTDNVDRQSVHDYTIQLFEFSQKYNGDYDGWETSVERN